MRAVIGIDIGSSAIKAVLFDTEGMLELHSEHRALNSRIADTLQSHFEENPKLVRAQVFDILRSFARFARESAITIEAIAFTGQMHGGLLVDANLDPVTNFITWQDKRGDEPYARKKSFVEKLRASALSDPTGVGIHTGFLISTLFWLKQQEKIPSRTQYVLGIYDWLTSILVGRPVTDISSAAAWGMFDPIAKAWRTDLLDLAGIPSSLLPDVVEPGIDLGTISAAVTEELGLTQGIHIHASIGDTQAAYLGSECKPNEILLNFGTGSQSMWETTRLEATLGIDIRYLRNGSYIACASTLAGGEAYRIAANFLMEVVKQFTSNEIPLPRTLEIMDRLALISNSDGMTIDPIFRGSKFRANSDRGSILGVSSDNLHPGAVVRALAEGMIEEVAAPYFNRNENQQFVGIVGEGSGFRRNPALQAIAQARFGLPIRTGRFEEGAAVGAAMLCL